jgi:chemotaxis protein CheX
MATDAPVLEVGSYGDCIATAADTTFQTVCGVSPQVVPCPPEGAKEEMVLAVISLVGQVEWSVFLGLPQATAMAAAAKFAGFEIPYESPDMGDAIGELTNILAGQVKSILDKRGVKVEISLPSVMRAADLHVLINRNVVTTKTCFESNMGKFWAGMIAKGPAQVSAA